MSKGLLFSLKCIESPLNQPPNSVELHFTLKACKLIY